MNNTAQKMKFSIKNFFSKCDQINRKLRVWSHLLKKSLMENCVFHALMCKCVFIRVHCCVHLRSASNVSEKVFTFSLFFQAFMCKQNVKMWSQEYPGQYLQ